MKRRAGFNGVWVQSHMQTKEPQRQEQHVEGITENSSCLVSGLQLSCVKHAAYGGIQSRDHWLTGKKGEKIKLCVSVLIYAKPHTPRGCKSNDYPFYI